MELHDLEVCHLRHSIQLGKIKTILYSAKISLPDFYLLQMFLTCTIRHTILHFTRIQIIEKYSRLGSVSLTVFRRNSNSMEISFFSYIDSNLMVATKCCTWYDSCAVMVCAKVCCDLMATKGITARQSIHRISMDRSKISLVKRAPCRTDTVTHWGVVRRCIWSPLVWKMSVSLSDTKPSSKPKLIIVN